MVDVIAWIGLGVGFLLERVILFNVVIDVIVPAVEEAAKTFFFSLRWSLPVPCYYSIA